VVLVDSEYVQAELIGVLELLEEVTKPIRCAHRAAACR